MSASGERGKSLERAAAEHFGVGRNIRRGQDYRIVDSDVDVFGPDKVAQYGFNLLVECKYRGDATVPKIFREWANNRPGPVTPILVLTVGNSAYLVRHLDDFDHIDPFKNRTLLNVWMKYVKLRANYKELDEWFQKCKDLYIPKKCLEFNVDPNTVRSLVVMRGRRMEAIVIQELSHDTSRVGSQGSPTQGGSVGS